MVSDTLTQGEAEPVNETMVNVKAKAVINTPADTLPKVHAKTFGVTLNNFEVVALVERPLATN